MESEVTRFIERTYVPSHEVSPGAAAQIHVAFRALERWLDGPVRWRDLTEPKVRDFLTEYAERAGWSPHTRANRRRDILAVWEAAALEGHVRDAPDRRRLPRPKVPRRVPTARTIDELSTIVAYLGTLDYLIAGIPARFYWVSLVQAMFCTAFRVSALRSIRSADCNLAEGWILVAAEHDKSGRDQIRRLSPAAVEAIAAHYQAGRELVWPWPWSAGYFSRRFRQHLTEAGFPPRGRSMDLFHTIRRTSATYAAREGGLRAAAALLGHADVRVTAASYVDPRIASDVDAIPVLPEIG